jgi:hypothetical protein
MCVKEGIGKYGMWYGVVCKVVMSFTSVVFSLPGGRDTVSILHHNGNFGGIPEPK